MEIDDGFKARIKNAKGEANKMRKEITGETVPVKLNDIVKHYRIPTRPADLEMEGCARMDNEGLCIILYKKSSPQTRQRFTVAHELGHIRLEHITFNGDTSQISSTLQEKEANAFAGELLVPATDLRQFLKSCDKTLDDVLKRYWVSKDVAVRAINQNKLLNKLKIDDD